MSTPQSGIQRQHELDALRAFAMLLGIAIHGALAYTSGGWIVQDQSSPFFEWLCSGIHGFRMALFMLISGYFTMMLWRKRGLIALLKQRALRVLLPLMGGMVIVWPLLIVAIVTSAGIVKWQDANKRRATGMTEELAAAVKARDLDAAYLCLVEGSDPNQIDIAGGLQGLTWAAANGDCDMIALLLENGAQVNVANEEGYGPLHLAAYLGQPKAVELLLQEGANPYARGKLSDTPSDATYGDLDYTKFVAAQMNIKLPSEEELQENRAACRTLLKAAQSQQPDPAKKPAALEESAGGSLSSVRKQYRAFINSSQFTVRLSRAMPEGKLFTGELFGHLWFLWHLCWLVAIFSLFVLASSFLPASFKVPSTLIVTPLRWLWIVPLTMVPQLFMGIVAATFGPDTSAGVLPQPHVLFYYAIFFFFGALYFDCDDKEGRLTQWWGLEIAVALLVVLPAYWIYRPDLVISSLLQVIYAWAMAFGLMGLFRTYLSRESKPIRYLSDSAYWLYLTHLPLLVLLQAVARGWDLSPFIKFTVVCLLTTVILLVVYEFMVRYSWIGSLLNGPRKRQRAQPKEEAQIVLAPSCQATQIG